MSRVLAFRGTLTSLCFSLFAFFVLAASAVNAAEDEVGVGEGPAVSSQEIAGRVAAGQQIDLKGAVVQGDLNFGDIPVTQRPIRCTKCRFEGAFNATDVIFERIVDLTDSVFVGPVELGGAIFEERAGFDAVTFNDEVQILSARFLHDVSFANTSFRKSAVFDRSFMGRGAYFGGSEFKNLASFNGAEFKAKADFSYCEFQENLFDGTIFGGQAFFYGADFHQDANFAGAEIHGTGAFQASIFRKKLTFDRVIASGPLEFEQATALGEVSFSSLANSGSLSLFDFGFEKGNRLFLTGLSVEDLFIPVHPPDDDPDIASVDSLLRVEEKEEVLQLVERSAKAEGNLSVANDARYELLFLESQRASKLTDRFGHWVYRETAGYLVRPWNPLRALLLLLVISWAARAAPALWTKRNEVWVVARRPAGRGKSGKMQKSHDNVLVFEKAMAVIFQGLSASISSAFRPKAQIAVKNTEEPGSYVVAALQWAEFFVYKVLLALFLLALGNANSTIREIFDAVRG